MVLAISVITIYSSLEKIFFGNGFHMLPSGLVGLLDATGVAINEL